jgi:phenylacetate-CoA ligase
MAPVNRQKISFNMWDAWRVRHGGTRVLANRQKERLASLVSFARSHSAFYQKLYSHLPPSIEDLRLLPPVTKPELMDNFDGWVTDPAVTRASLEAFVADQTLIGQFYLGRYAACMTSGITGKPGLFLHDGNALAIYAAFVAMRGYLSWLSSGQVWAMLRQETRFASVLATSGHFGGVIQVGLGESFRSRPSDRRGFLSVMTPLPELVQALNDFQPVILGSYPSLVALLAEEQIAGRLKINPVIIVTSGEWLAPVVRDHIAAAFNCPVREVYACSEFLGVAFSCSRNWLHVNSDWVIMEPVDESYQPTPPGQPSHTVLLTNLANRVQPVIRYNLGDSITASPDPCPCGNPLPAIRVEGRRDEILALRTPEGKTIPLMPMTVTTAVEVVPGVHRFQIIQTAPATLTIRLEVSPGADAAQVWEAVAIHLRSYLSTQGLSSVTVEKAAEPPQAHPVSGKFRQAWVEPGAID